MIENLNKGGITLKFSINKTELQNALTTVQKGVSTRSTLPVLSGILLDVQQEKVILQSTDLELSIQYTVDALIEEEGKTVVPGKLFTDIIKNLPDAAIHIQSDDGEAKITCDNSTFSVHTLNYEDFPGFPKVETSQNIAIPFDKFASMVKKVSRVVSRDESRAILTGVLITFDEGKLRMVATDSYRLALTEIPMDNPSVDEFQCVIAGNFLNEIAGLSSSDDDLTIALAENQIVVNYQNVVFINRRIEGNYPNYKQLIPSEYTTRATIDLSELISSVKRASLLSSSTAPMKFDLNIASQTMQITVTSPDVGSVQETLVCEIEGEDTEIAFNSSYVIDGLTAVKGEKVYLEVQSSLKPGIFRALEPENFLYLIMPVRI